MAIACKKCGHKNIRFPLWKGQEEGEPFAWSKIIWINLFKIDMMSIIFIALVLFMAFAYKHDIAQCNEVISSPCIFCANTGCFDKQCLRSEIIAPSNLTNLFQVT